MELIVIALLFGGGILVSGFFMILASRKSATIVRIVINSALAIGCLAVQRSCWNAASNIGAATGGSSSDIAKLPEILIGVCVVWAIILLLGSFNNTPEDE